MLFKTLKSVKRVAQRAWLSPNWRCVTNVWAGRRRMWPMFNKEYLRAVKISHEDLSEPLPDFEALERLVQPKGNDDNGRAGYPTRLLDVGLDGSSSIALVHSAQAIDKNGKYMTLRHRWGDAKVPTLTTKTIINWAQELSVKILPKTFQDFIMLAQRPQIRNVWIDCVSYRRAITVATGELKHLLWTKFPLSVRGWVVQERWLCPRNLLFGPREVFFECGQTTLSERFPNAFPEPLLEGDVIFKSAFGNLQTLRSPQATLLPATPGTKLYTAWGSDRTVAFSGIAKFFRSLVDDNYIAGLWLRNLASDMMWYRHRLLTTAVFEDTKDRLCLFKNDAESVYRAPSFSWASTAMPIEPNHMEDNPYFDGEMTDFYVVPDSPSGSSKKMNDWSESISKETAEATLDFQVNNDDVATLVAKDNLYYIPWQDCWNSHLPSKSRRDGDSLTCLLVELADVSMNRFRRVGRLYIHDTSKRKLYMAKQGNETTLPCEQYDPRTRRHTIYLI
ncbi:hypothetical protein V8C34DRAFT_314567 [Trichoderma compactum]